MTSAQDIARPREAQNVTRPGEPRDVVFAFCYVTWDGAYQRGMNFAQDRLLETLFADPGVRRLLVANPYRSAPRRVARSLLGRDRAFPGNGKATLHSPLRLRRDDPTGIRALERTYRAYDRSLEAAARRAGLERPAVIAMHPMVAGFAPLEWAGQVTFYATDDWASHWAYRDYWKGFDEAYRRVRETGRALCAVSDEIVERVRPTGPSMVVPNGIAPQEWVAPGPPPDWFAALPSPRCLYIGNLDSRIDVAQVRDVAAAYPGGSVVLVGPEADPDHLAPLRAVSNVHLHPRVGRPEVPGLLAAADVCLVPHNRTRLTEAMSPLKVYEYLAAGRPVASVDLAPIRSIGSRIVLVGENTTFSEGVAAALRLGPASESERRRFLSDNSWRRRHEHVLGLALA